MNRVPDHLLRDIRDMNLDFEYKRAGEVAKTRFSKGRQQYCDSEAERLIFHGTDADNLERIFDYGFDPAMRSRNERHQRFGPGEYFSTDHASAAAWGREHNPRRHIVVIVAVVLDHAAKEHVGTYKGRTDNIVRVENQDDATFVHPISYVFHDFRATLPPLPQAADDDDDDDDDTDTDDDGTCQDCSNQAKQGCNYGLCGACCDCEAHNTTQRRRRRR